MLLRSSPCFHISQTLCLTSARLRYLSNSSASKPPYRVLLFGADDFSCHTLRALHSEQPDLIGEIIVVTPPDSRTGRNLKVIHRPPLRVLAEKLSIESISFPSTGLKGWEPPASFLNPSPSNLLLAASFGHLIPSRILSRFNPGHTMNVHPSLLPKYRGAAPIQWSIINGDTITGVSIQELSRGTFDQGRLLGSKEVPMPPNSTFETLEPILAKIGADLLINVLRDLPAAQAASIAQDSSLATLAPKILKENLARISWDSEPIVLDQLQRGVSHHFSLTTILPTSSTNAEPIHFQLQLSLPSTIINPPSPSSQQFTSSAPGTIYFEKLSKSLLVRAGKEGGAYIIIERIKAPGGKWIKASEWWLNFSRGKEFNSLRFE